MKILRTEEWERDIGGMISTGIVNVFEGEVVRLSPELAREMKMDPAQSKEVVPEGCQHFVWEYPYEVFRKAIIESGMTYARTS